MKANLKTQNFLPLYKKNEHIKSNKKMIPVHILFTPIH